jgi:hypothetical protein
VRVQLQKRASTVFAAVLILAGCSGSDAPELEMGHVTGTVTYSKPLPEGQVVFQHKSGEQTAAKFGADGKYALDVPVGVNQAMVRSIESTAAAQPKEGEQGPRGMEVHSSRIPDHYSDFARSMLGIEVKPGENTYDIKLEDK